MKPKPPFKSHDLTLPAWGPYTKKYSGISHIPAANDGVPFSPGTTAAGWTCPTSPLKAATTPGPRRLT